MKKTFSLLLALMMLCCIAGAAQAESYDKVVMSYDYYAHTFGEPSALLSSDRAPKTLAKLRKEAGAKLPRLFLACGTEDFLYSANLDMHEALTALSIPHEWLTHPGIHDFKFWNYALPLALDWIQHSPEQ